jgi:Flp pilus assembly protein TadG
MTAQSPSDHILLKLRRFHSARDGNVAIIFALLLIPLIGGVGAAIHYSRASSAKTMMQAALDSTALLVAKEADTLSPGQVQQKAQSIFQALYSTKGVENPQITSTYDPNTGQLSLAGTVGLKTTLAGVLGVNHMNIAANTKSLKA